MTEAFPRLSTATDERSLALEKYYSLQSRQQQARRRLSSSSSSSAFSTASSSTSPTDNAVSTTTRESSHQTTTVTSSPSRSPTRPHNHTRGNSRSSLLLSGPSSPADESAIDDSFGPCLSRNSSIACSAGTPESELLELDNDIKATLTTLLNLPSVRHEVGGAMRAWVQERLMDAEMEMRRLRRGICRCGAGMVVQ